MDKRIISGGRTKTGAMLLRIGCLSVFTAIVFCPPAALVLDLVQTGLKSPLFPTGRQLTLLLQTLAFGIGVAATAMIAGFAAGTRLWQWRRPILMRIRWLALFTVIVTPYVHALAWSSTFNALNRMLAFIGLQPVPFQGWLAAWWVNSMALCPIALGMTLLGLESVDVELIECGRIMKPDTCCLRKIVFPLAAPQIGAGAAFVFLLSITDYSVPSLFGMNVYPLEIFSVYSATGEASAAFLTAIPLLGIALAVLAAAQAPLRDAALRPIRQNRSWTTDLVWPVWLQFFQRLAILLFAFQILIPVASLVLGSRNSFLSAAFGARREILFSAWTSLAAAVACLPMAFAVAKQMAGKGAAAGIWWLLAIAPLAIPAPLVGIGLVQVWNRMGTAGIYGSWMMPVLAALARFTPVATIVLLAQLRRIDPSLLEAADVYHTSLWKTWTRIHGPMFLPGFVAAACAVFALTAGELGATLIVAPPGQATLTMKIYNYLHYGASQTVAGLCLIMAVIGLAAGAAAILGIRGWARLRASARMNL
jgi:iron(III) transport system permease protein